MHFCLSALHTLVGSWWVLIPGDNLLLTCFFGGGVHRDGGFTDWEACKMGGLKEGGLEKEGGL